MEDRRRPPLTPSQTQTQTQTKREREARKPRSLPEIPETLNQEAWQRYADYRKAIKKQYKPASLEAAMKKLAAYGKDQAAVVEQTIAAGWTGLFDLKTNSTGKDLLTYQQAKRVCQREGLNERVGESAAEFIDRMSSYG